MTRLDVIQILINRYNLQEYLEIGTKDGETFNAVKITSKTGVDPDINSCKETTYKVTSDYFFDKINQNKKYDIIFIDGLHKKEQVIKDIKNSLDCLNDIGFIVVHDCNPPTEFIAREADEFDGKGFWCGDVYLGYLEHVIKDTYLNYFTVDCDWGVGVIWKEKRNDKIYSMIKTFEEFENNRDKLLNLKNQSWFIKNHMLG